MSFVIWPLTLIAYCISKQQRLPLFPSQQLPNIQFFILKIFYCNLFQIGELLSSLPQKKHLN